MPKFKETNLVINHTMQIQVIPPGMDFSSVKAQDLVECDADLKALIGTDKSQKKPIPHIWSEVCHSFLHCYKIPKKKKTH